MLKRVELRNLKLGAMWVSLAFRGSKSIMKKRETKAEAARRRKIFDETRPHHGNDLIRALEYENFMRDSYEKAWD